MSPIRSLGNRSASFRNRFGDTGTNAALPFVPIPPNDFDGTGAVYAFSGNNTTDDATDNGNSITNYYQFSTTQKKWTDYTHSFETSGDTWANRLEFPTWTPSADGWSFEFWVYPTTWAGKYLLNFDSGSLSINVQSGEFRFYRIFTSSQQNWTTTTSNLLNQWNFFQIYYDTTNTKFMVNGTERASLAGNTGTPSQVVLANKVSTDTFGTTGFWNDIVFYNGVNRGAQSVPTTPFGH